MPDVEAPPTLIILPSSNSLMVADPGQFMQNRVSLRSEAQVF
ncbi:MAG: hypothetical protein RIG84_12780 [Roseovarius sp.]